MDDDVQNNGGTTSALNALAAAAILSRLPQDRLTHVPPDGTA